MRILSALVPALVFALLSPSDILGKDSANKTEIPEIANVTEIPEIANVTEVPENANTSQVLDDNHAPDKDGTAAALGAAGGLLGAGGLLAGGAALAAGGAGGGGGANAAGRPLPITGADTRQCKPMDFKVEEADELEALDDLTDLAVRSGDLKKSFIEQKMDPLEMRNQVSPRVNITIAGIDFQIEPVVVSLDAKGLSDLKYYNFEPVTSKEIRFGVNFQKNIYVKGEMHINVYQKNWRKGIPCLTNWLNPIRCKPRRFKLRAEAGFDNLGLKIHAMVDMFKCADESDPDRCQDLSVADMAVLILTQRIEELMKLAFFPVKNAEVKGVELSFDKMTDYKFSFVGAGKLFNALADRYMRFPPEEVNKRGERYQQFLKLMKQFMMQGLADKIKNEFSLLFHGTCSYSPELFKMLRHLKMPDLEPELARQVSQLPGGDELEGSPSSGAPPISGRPVVSHQVSANSETS